MTPTRAQTKRLDRTNAEHDDAAPAPRPSPLELWLERLKHRPSPSFSLEIERLTLTSGTLHCVLGPTGSGKTTLLRLLAGIERPHDGQIWVQDSGLQRTLQELRGQSAAVFQRPMLVTGTVDYNVELGLRFQGLPRQERRRRVAEYLKLLGIEHLSGRPVRRLSGGEIRLVALARALAIQPRILLLDEPTADLDPMRVQHVETVIRSLCHESGTLVVWTTHVLQQARRLADQVVQLHGGRLKRYANVEEFFGTLTDEELQWLLYA